MGTSYLSSLERLSFLEVLVLITRSLNGICAKQL